MAAIQTKICILISIITTLRCHRWSSGLLCNTGWKLRNLCQDIADLDSTNFNHDGSINSDDGRLNFDQGDIVSAPTKATIEFETRSGNLQAFLRTTMYYDAALMDDGCLSAEVSQIG